MTVDQASTPAFQTAFISSVASAVGVTTNDVDIISVTSSDGATRKRQLRNGVQQVSNVHANFRIRSVQGSGNAVAAGLTNATTVTGNNIGAIAGVVKSLFAVNFTACTNFVLQSQTDMTFGGGQTTLVGDIGIAPGTSITGSYLQGTKDATHPTDATAAACTAAMPAIALMASTTTCQSIDAELGKDTTLRTSHCHHDFQPLSVVSF